MKRFAEIIVALVALVPVAAGAEVSRGPVPVFERPILERDPAARMTASPFAHPRLGHIVYGAIASVGATSLVLRMRNGRLLFVDDSAALRDGTYSAPLAVGKIVAVEGSYGPTGVFFAARVSRTTRLDESTGPDR